MSKSDAEANPTSRTDAEGHAFTTVFDELGRPTSITGPIGEPEEGTTLFEYDLTGLLLARTDADQRQIALRYDALGRMVESKDGLGRSTYFAFDELGNLIERVDGAGERLRMEHDASGRVVRRTSAGSGSAAPIDDRYRFDGFGRLVLARNAHTTLTYGYDALDRALSVTDGVSGTAQLRYDVDGRTVQAIYPNGAAYGYPEGVSVHYLYNARGQLQAVVDPVAGIWQLEYDAAGRAVRRIDPSGVQRRVIYDDADGSGYGFVERVEIARPGVSTAESFVYGDYDLLGNPRRIDQTSTLTGGVTGTTAVQYDSLSRVKSVTYPGGAGGESFGYDRVGNRTRHVNRQGQDRTYLVDAAHQLKEVRETATSALVERFVYDGAGRRRQRIDASNALLESYAYDARGALTEYTQASGYSFALDYDATGYRRERTDTTGQARYFGEWAEHRGGKRRRMVFGSGLGAPLAEIGDGDPNQPQVVRALHEDGTANVTHVAATSAGGAPAFESMRRYEAFGARLITASTQVERSFAGRPTEGASSLLRMGARHYDPSTGTFLQVDPLVLGTNQAYAYASQNPYRFWDPTGLRSAGINTHSPYSATAGPDYSSAGFAQSLAYRAGFAAERAGAHRATYDLQSGGLARTIAGSFARDDLVIDTRRLDPPEVRSLVEFFRPIEQKLALGEQVRAEIAAGSYSRIGELQHANAGVSAGARLLRGAGAVAIVGGIGYAAYNVHSAPPGQWDNVAAREVGGLGGAVAGGFLGAQLGLACGAGAVVCSPVGGVAGGIVGGIAGEGAVNAAYGAIEGVLFGGGP